MGDVGLHLFLRSPVFRRAEAAEQCRAGVDGDLTGPQIAVGDLMAVQGAERLPDRVDGSRFVGLCQRRAAGRGVGEQGPAAVQSGQGQRRGVGDSEVADGDGHQCPVLDGPVHRGLQGSGLAVPQDQPAPELAQRATAALVGAVQLDHCGAPGGVGGGQFHRALPGRAHHRQRGGGEPAARERPDRVVEGHLQSRGAHHPHDQGADEPADRQAEQRPGRYHGADHQMDRDERQQQSPPPAPPSGRQPRARHRQDRRQHRDPARVVEELRQHRGEPLIDVEMPTRSGDPAAGDRQCEHRDDAGRCVRTQQAPLPAGDQTDEDHERQCHDRDAVGQVHQVGLKRGQHTDDPGDRPFQADPVAAGDQRTGDDDRQEYRRQCQPEDVGGPPGQRLQQVSGDSDLPTVDPHPDELSRSAREVR